MIKNTVFSKEGNREILEQFISSLSIEASYHNVNGYDAFAFESKDIISDDLRKFSREYPTIPFELAYEISGMQVDAHYINGMDLEEEMGFFLHERNYM
jgi:hypothetical protein